MRLFLLVALLLSSVYGCGGAYYQPIVRHFYETNYKLGEYRTAYVGQSVLKVRDYYTDKIYGSNVLVPTEDFTLNVKIPQKSSFYNLNVVGSKGERYDTSYKEAVDGVLYHIVDFTDSTGKSYGVLIDGEGNVQTKFLYKNIIPIDFKLQPPNVKFLDLTSNAAGFSCCKYYDPYQKMCGCINFELIYGGINSVSLNMSYKEYSREDYARTAFYQEITFEPTAKQIRFKDFIIKIIEATNDKLVYEVIYDGLKNTEFYEEQAQDACFIRFRYGQ